EEQDLILLDVTPHALGLLTAGKHFEELIAQNTTVPTSHTKHFTTSRDNQTAVKILVVQREGEENTMLGEFLLSGLRPAPKGAAERREAHRRDREAVPAGRADRGVERFRPRGDRQSQGRAEQDQAGARRPRPRAAQGAQRGALAHAADVQGRGFETKLAVSY